MARGGPVPNYGGPGPWPQVLSISTSGTRGDTGPVPSGKWVRDHWSCEMESRTMPRTTAMTSAIPRSVLPTVLDHCTPTIRGEDDDFHDPLCMYTVPPCVYKRGGSAHSVEHNA